MLAPKYNIPSQFNLLHETQPHTPSLWELLGTYALKLSDEDERKRKPGLATPNYYDYREPELSVDDTLSQGELAPYPAEGVPTIPTPTEGVSITDMTSSLNGGLAGISLESATSGTASAAPGGEGGVGDGGAVSASE